MSTQPPWDAFRPQDPHQGQYPQQPPYGQQPYPQGPPQYGQPGPGQHQGQPPYPGQQQGPYPQPGQNPWQPQSAYLPPGGPRRRKSWPARHKVLTVLGGIIGLIVVASVASAAANGSHPSASSAAPPATQAAAAATSSATPSPTHSAAARARTVATFTGSGTEKTRRFTVTSTWKLTYSFSCAEFGQSGNFQVFEDGGSDFSGVEVNDLAMSKSASTWAYDDGGTHYLEVNSECSWKVKVIDEPQG